MGRKRKDEGGTLYDKAEVWPAARHVAPLRKPADVTAERKRLYRAVLNGRVSPGRGCPALLPPTSIRSDLEADMPPQIDHAPGGYVVDTVIINGVAPGTFLPKEEIDRLNSQFVEVPPAHIAGPPMLKVFDNVDDDTGEEPPPQAA